MKSLTKKPIKKISVLATKLIALLLVFTLAVGSLSGCGTLIRWLEDLFKPDGEELVIPDDVEFRPLKDIADELFAYLVSSDFTTYHQLIANPASFGIPVPASTFSDISTEASIEEFAYLRTLYYQVLIHDLPERNPAGVADNERRLYEYLVFFLETYLELEPYIDYFDPYEPSTGAHISLPLSLLTFSFNTKQDIDSYLALLADIPRVFDQANAVVQERTAKGIFPNRAAVESSIEEAETYTAQLADNILVTSFEAALKSNAEPFASLTQDERTHYTNANRVLVEALIIPAYKNVITVLQNLIPRTNYNITIASYPSGRSFYAAMFNTYGFAESPDEAIAILDDALDYYANILSGELIDYDRLNAITAQTIPHDAAEMISYFNAKVAEDFPDIGKRPFVVDSASDEEVIKMFTAFYLLAPVDDLTINQIKYYPQNIGDIFDLGTTLAHESFPGHLYQYNYFGLTQNPHPIEQLLGATAYVEGYAVYSQYYALRYMGLSARDAQVANAYELFWRALQARLDLGINYQGWNVGDTRTFLNNWGYANYATAFFRQTASVPLIMLPYGLGPLKFFELLEDAQLAMGARFDTIAFHAVVLENGAVPLGTLERNVKAWIN